ncbi:hypothetical protein HOU02_gp166 [Caulobacter phage CcrBL9]|uniref:Uncharacterized protein n=1 Tax=Caulobacter phage CcrBL9 TaxID=2283270 RepID=A0A385EB73_9CAUD|nr:hypothetical protein HOU02_gp019 [Caulobacter phage CcrBL9]YP_009810189.1 hypothetical protein HOU02_gp166 [Caulobacter phage CcrBL9]AXQ69043.1 hypothetical protein CcrBL9_gp019 [Caulobacter phage CcrBL9]AXQ69559.1 hypothetical protein CcrBL9_gp535 [Caulobacter phage CcrBL9]
MSKTSIDPVIAQALAELRQGPVMVDHGPQDRTQVVSFGATQARMANVALTIEQALSQSPAPYALGWLLVTEYDRLGDNWGGFLGGPLDEGQTLKDADEVLAWFRATFPEDPEGFAGQMAGALPNDETRAKIEAGYAEALAIKDTVAPLANIGSAEAVADMMSTMFGSAVNAAQALGYLVTTLGAGRFGVTHDDGATLATRLEIDHPTQEAAARAALVYHVQHLQADTLALANLKD